MEKEFRKMVPFGLNKKSVDLFLKKLHSLQENELNELRKKVELARTFDEAHGNELKELRNRQRQSRTIDLLESKILKPEEELSNNPPSIISTKPNLKLISLPMKGNIQVSNEPPTIEPPLIEIDVIVEKIAIETIDPEPAVIEPDSINRVHIEKKAKSKVTRSSDGFWEDADFYLDEDSVDSEDLVNLNYIESKPQKNHNNSSEKIEKASKLIEEDNSVDEDEIPLEDSPEETEDTEIDKIKRNYIVGKLAGEDLIDSRGRVILVKHQPITDAIVKRAQREGKLVELIVNMVMPGWDE